MGAFHCCPGLSINCWMLHISTVPAVLLRMFLLLQQLYGGKSPWSLTASCNGVVASLCRLDHPSCWITNLVATLLPQDGPVVASWQVARSQLYHKHVVGLHA